MNELKIFEHPDFGKIRTVTIDDEPYLVGKDVAEVLGYSNTKRGRSGTEKEDTMTYGDMTVRQFLNGVREAKTEVLNLQRKLLELKTASENITAHWKDVPGGGGGSDPHKDEIVNALCDLNTSYGEKVLAYLRYMEETEAFIDTVSGFENRLILQLRYVDCMKWDTIEATMRRMGIYYSTRHITRLHGYALLAAERAWAVWKETERHEDRNSQQEDQ